MQRRSVFRDLAAGFSAKNIKVRTKIGTANDVGMEIVRIAENEPRRYDRHRHSRHDRLAQNPFRFRRQESRRGSGVPGSRPARTGNRPRRRNSSSHKFFQRRRLMVYFAPRNFGAKSLDADILEDSLFCRHCFSPLLVSFRLRWLFSAASSSDLLFLTPTFPKAACFRSICCKPPW